MIIVLLLLLSLSLCDVITKYDGGVEENCSANCDDNCDDVSDVASL